MAHVGSFVGDAFFGGRPRRADGGYGSSMTLMSAFKVRPIFMLPH